MLALIGPRMEFNFIPEILLAEVKADVMEQYQMAAQRNNVVCLDENVVQMTSFNFLRILYYREFGSVVDEGMHQDPEEWHYLHERYPIVKHAEDYVVYRKELKSILMESQMIFEENWVFSNSESKDYIVGMHNEPLQSVW